MARSSTRFRDDYRTSYNLADATAPHFGGEWLHQWGPYFQCTNCMGTYDGGSNRPPANFESLFPNILDVSTWNLAPLSPLFRTYSVGISAAGFKQRTPKEIGAGVGAGRLDDDVSPDAQSRAALRHQQGAVRRTSGDPAVGRGRTLHSRRTDSGRGSDSPYTLNDRTVIRGGTGKYFADVSDQVSSWTERYGGGEINAQVANDGRPDFAGNPWNSRPQPTYEEALRIPGLRKSVSQIATPGLGVPYSYQSSIGLQRQFGTTMALAGGLRREQQPARAVPAQHQSDLQPRHRRELRVHGRLACGVRRLGRRQRVPVRGVVQLPCARDSVHQASEPPVAGLRHVHAVGLQGWHDVASAVASTWCRTSGKSTDWRRPTSATARCSTASGTSGTAFN